MRRLWFILSLSMLLSLARAAVPEKPLVLGPPLPTLKPVSTLEDLKKLEPIEVGDASVRLAIETDKVPVGSGLLVYCLWDGKGQPAGGITRADESKSLGLCAVKLRRIYEDGQTREPEVQRAYDLQKVVYAQFKSDALFIASVLPSAPGKYELSILSPSGDRVARARIACAGRASLGWRELVRTDFERKGAPYAPGNLMAPKWNDALFIDVPRTLPTFVPPGNLMEIKATAAPGGRISLTSEKDMRADLAESFLMRVYINGQPADDTKVEMVNHAMEDASADQMVRKLSFTVSTKLEDYGAAAGDGVEVQFLYCPGGAEFVPRENVMEKLVDARKRTAIESRGVCMSNKVQIITPAKPKPAATRPATAPYP